MRSRSLAVGVLCWLGLASPAVAATLPFCSHARAGWCVARRFAGDALSGELGFRFGEPLDVDGDGRADVAAGARFTLHDRHQSGRVSVWSGKNGALIRTWDGPAGQDALFGHWVLPIPDLGTDGLADLIIAAPNLVVDGVNHGLVVARSPKTGAELWRRIGGPLAILGWDLALAGDHDSDGHVDVFVGQPAADGGRVLLLSGKDGSVLRTYAPREAMSSFGWFVARLDDLDGDGAADLAVGAQPQHGPDDPPGGAAYVMSARTGQELQRWRGTDPSASFGEVVAAVGDLDGDGHGEVVVSAPGTNDRARARPGELTIYSGTSGAPIRQWSGTQPGELYGRMVTAVGDLDGDGVEDLAIGAPWHRTDAGDRVGRVELRSGRSGAVLQELLGELAGSWFGWHIRRAPDPDGLGRPTLLIGSLRQRVGKKDAVGVLDLCVLRRTPAPHGTITRGARRSAIK